MIYFKITLVVSILGSTTGQDVWPAPQQMVTSDKIYLIDPSSFIFEVVGAPDLEKCLILKDSIRRTKENAFLTNCSRVTSHPQENEIRVRSPKKKLVCRLLNRVSTDEKIVLKKLTINIHHKCEEYPHQDMDEMYSIRIDSPDFPDQAVLFADNIWGAVRGLQTFSQLVYPSPSDPSKFEVKGVFLLDFPRFTHRGVLVDSSRHYIPLKLIYQNLDAMEYNKLNVFHWHIVDDQSFPFVSKYFPDMSVKGAYNSKTHIYTPEEVSSVIEYARLRGIRVLPEFDTPGHTLSWGKSIPGLLTACYNTKTKKPDGTFGPMDPTKNSTFEFLEKFLDEVSKVFEDQYIHIGGDEVNKDCWKSSPAINDFMNQMAIKDYDGLEDYFMQRLVKIVEKLNKSYIVWQEVFDDGVILHKDAVVHVWKGNFLAEWEKELLNVTSTGYRVIVSSPWYLNYIHYGPDWTLLYGADPQSFSEDPKLRQLVMGGEITMWSEFVDGSNFMSRTWPRGCAVAERLWSHERVNDTSTALPRIRKQACRMQTRGLRVEPINGPGFCPCDYLYQD